MSDIRQRGTGFWAVQGPGWVLVLYLIYAQAIPAFDYQLGVSMGTQESAEAITEVGAAFWHGFASGWDLTNETAYWIALPIVSLWGAFGLWQVAFR